MGGGSMSVRVRVRCSVTERCDVGGIKEEKVLDGTRTRNLPLRRRMPYPLGHEDTMEGYTPLRLQFSTPLRHPTHSQTTRTLDTQMLLGRAHGPQATAIHYHRVASSLLQV